MGLKAQPLEYRVIMHIRHVDDRGDLHRHVMDEVIVAHVTLVSSPSRVAPSVATAVDVDFRARRYDFLHRVMLAGAGAQVEIARGVGERCLRRHWHERKCGYDTPQSRNPIERH